MAVLPDGVSVVGVVVGNSKSEVGSVSQIEEHDVGMRVVRTETHDFLSLGQAIAASSLLDGESILLANLKTTQPDKDRRLSLRSHLGNEMVRRTVQMR